MKVMSFLISDMNVSWNAFSIASIFLFFRSTMTLSHLCTLETIAMVEWICIKDSEEGRETGANVERSWCPLSPEFARAQPGFGWLY